MASKQPRFDWARSGRASIDWDRLIGLALLENSVTVLEERVAALPPGSVPAAALEQISRLALVWQFRLKHLRRRLEESVVALSAAGIDVALLKGAALGLTVYPAFEQRPMADIDLMVDPVAAGKAYEILQATGWSIQTGSHTANSWLDHHHLAPLADVRGSGLRLELHTAPLVHGHPFRLTTADFLGTSRPIWIGKSRVRVGDVHLHAVHAAIHLVYSHQFASGNLNFFRDVATLVELNEWSWTRFLHCASYTNSESCCYWALRMTRAVTGLEIPAPVLDRLSPHLGERVLGILEKHFSQIILRAEYACPSVELRQQLWAYALQLGTRVPRSSKTWAAHPGDASSPARAAVRRVSRHFRQVPQWSRYLASLIGAMPGLTS